MPERAGLHVHLTRTARSDIALIVKRSFQEFGEMAAWRYEALIRQALLDIGDDPERPGSKQRPEIMIESARTYHLEFSRTRVRGSRVGTPRHFLLYRRRNVRLVEVGRILHDSRDLAASLPASYRLKL